LLGRFEAAVESARAAIADRPDDVRGWLSLGAAQLDLGRDSAARGGVPARLAPWRPSAGTRRVLSVGPADSTVGVVLLGLTKRCSNAGRADEALATLRAPGRPPLARDEPQMRVEPRHALLRLGPPPTRRPTRSPAPGGATLPPNSRRPAVDPRPWGRVLVRAPSTSGTRTGASLALV
jgi:hypothetical protein